MTDATVSVNFSASTTDLNSGIASARDALASLAAPIAEINDKYAALGAALAEAHARAMQAVQSGDNAAYADSLRAAQEALSGRVRAEKEGLRRTAVRLCRRGAIRRDQRAVDGCKPRATRSSRPMRSSSTCMDRKRDLARSRLAQRQRIDNQIAQARTATSKRQLAQVTQQSLANRLQRYEQLRRDGDPRLQLRN